MSSVGYDLWLCLFLEIFYAIFQRLAFLCPRTSKKLEGHIASGVFVRPSVRSFLTLFDAYHNFRTVHATVLKFLIWIPHKKIADTCFFFLFFFCFFFVFLTGLCRFSELQPFEKIWMQTCQKNISKSIEARSLKLD